MLLEAGEADEACAEMSRVLDACVGISSPPLASKVLSFGRTAARLDSKATRDCVARIHEVVRGDPE
ncbi:hypothetical protein [Streptomyces sp. XH2]|uniref:hypothetical protein n=1 Tax=Streptomyces sp. XH2 TaxID=3412483 RepID=UPI003C7A6B7A